MELDYTKGKPPTFPPSTLSNVFMTSITRVLISSWLNPAAAEYPLHLSDTGERTSVAWGRSRIGVILDVRDGRARMRGIAARYMIWMGRMKGRFDVTWKMWNARCFRDSDTPEIRVRVEGGIDCLLALNFPLCCYRSPHSSSTFLSCLSYTVCIMARS